MDFHWGRGGKNHTVAYSFRLDSGSSCVAYRQHTGQVQIKGYWGSIALHQPLAQISLFLAFPTDDVNILEIPQYLAERLGVSVFAGQIIVTTLLTIMFLAPFIKMKAKPIINIAMLFLSISTCVAIGWCPYWVLLMLALMVAGLYAVIFKRMFG